jgi:hypothetical protein
VSFDACIDLLFTPHIRARDAVLGKHLLDAATFGRAVVDVSSASYGITYDILQTELMNDLIPHGFMVDRKDAVKSFVEGIVLLLNHN